MKLLLYIVFVVAIFLFVQNKFNLFDVKLIDTKETTEETKDTSNSNAKSQEAQSTAISAQNYVEIVTGANKTVRVNVEIANTERERMLGLSFRKYLGDYEGMLFAYDKAVSNPFWMKDMQIGLDMIFVDSQYFIVDVKKELSPCTVNYCPNVYSKVAYQYVLEVNSGFCEKNNIAEGESLVLHLESVN